MKLAASPMPRFDTGPQKLSEDELRNIAAYVASVAGLPPQPAGGGTGATGATGATRNLDDPVTTTLRGERVTLRPLAEQRHARRRRDPGGARGGPLVRDEDGGGVGRRVHLGPEGDRLRDRSRRRRSSASIGYHEEDTPDYRHAGMDLFLATESQDRALGSEALRLLARHLFEERGHHRLVIDPAASNARAIRAYEAVGFKPVGVMRLYERGPDGTFHDGLLMDLLADELRLGGSARLGLGSRSTTTCVIGRSKRSLARSTIPCSSQFERPGGCVETTISSAGNIRSESSIAWSGSSSPTVPRASMPVLRQGGERLVQADLRGGARRVLVGGPVADTRVQGGRHDENLGVALLRPTHDLAAEGAAGDGLVGDHENPVAAVRVAAAGPRPRARRPWGRCGSSGSRRSARGRRTRSAPPSRS